MELPFGCLRGVFYPRVLRVSVECVNHLFCVLARLLNYFTVVEGDFTVSTDYSGFLGGVKRER